MKFGEQLEQASVPGWSLHNIDYGSLKHQIKAHTAKDQAAAATAVAIPGQLDHTLKRFEDAFYFELCAQHDRVGLFVTSKVDEISRRLHHLCGLVHHLMLKCADTRGLSAKRQRRFAKYQTQIEECGQDIKAVRRFVDAQVTAFRKILKKYKKWTGSTTLGTRFRDSVLANPKSFSNYNPAPLLSQYLGLRTTLDAALPADANNFTYPPPTEQRDHSGRRTRPDSRQSSLNIATSPPTYWNEYEHGSEAGDHDDAYVIYIDPDAGDQFPGLAYIKTLLGIPIDHVRHWIRSQMSRGATSTTPSETQALLGPPLSTLSDASSPPADYFSIGGRLEAATTVRHGSTAEDEYLSSDEGEPYYPHSLGFFSRYSYSSSSSAMESDLKAGNYQDRVLTQSIILAFVAAFMLLGVSSLLVVTGRRRLRLEVDAGATLGSVVSLFCACMGLCAMLYRQSPGGLLYRLTVWAAFIIVCALNGTLLVIVASSSGL